MRFGVIVGRFQVPTLHPGHQQLFTYTLSQCDQVLCLIGSSVKPDIRNILSYDIRKSMIEEEIDSDKLTICNLVDVGDIDKWSTLVDDIIADKCDMSKDDVKLYGSRDSWLSTYCGRFTDKIEVPEIEAVSGTKIRDEIYSSVMSSADFRKGVIYGFLQAIS